MSNQRQWNTRQGNNYWRNWRQSIRRCPNEDATFSFSPITASDITNFEIAIARTAQDQDLSQDMSDQQAAVEQAFCDSVAEIANLIAQGEIHTAEIAAAGDIVVRDIRSWTSQAKEQFVQHQEQFLKQKDELEHMASDIRNLIQQSQTKFHNVDNSQQKLRARDLETLRSDFQSHISQIRSSFPLAVTALLALHAAQTTNSMCSP